MSKSFIVLFNLLMCGFFASGQSTDSITLKVEGVQSEELLDYYRFEGIEYFNMQLSGDGLADKYFMLTSDEYWNGELTNTDTIANTKFFMLKNGTDDINIRVLSQKMESDSSRFYFSLPRFHLTKKLPATSDDSYSLRDITSMGEETFAANQPIILLVYSLPYEDPEQPGYKFYCELSREGIPPEQWGDKFGVKHYIVFRFHLVD